MSMIGVRGTRLDGRSVPRYTWNADLIAFDGPLLSLFKGDDGNDVLFSWLDCNSQKNRWCIVPVGRTHLRLYLTQSIPLLPIFQASRSIVLFDCVARRKTNFVRTTWQNLPIEYLPAENSYLYDSIATDAARQLAQDMPRSYSLGIDGELYLEDLSGIPKLYQQLYSFHYGLEHLGRTAVRDTLARLLRKWGGGFSAVNLFTGLNAVTPSIHRARLLELQYNSPGHIKLDLLPNMADRIKETARRIEDEETFVAAEDLYRSVYKFFRENKIEGFEDERSVAERKLTPEQSKSVSAFINTFFDLMNWGPYSTNFRTLDVRPISQLRILLAYYRRLRRLREFVVSEKLTLR